MMKQNNKLPRSFYNRSDVLEIAQELLGKTLCTKINQQICKAKITEVEAYCGRTDEGCHAYPNKKTKRTEVMYSEGGYAYIYLCYGIHTMFNVVTNAKGLANCILVRAIDLYGTDLLGDTIWIEKATNLNLKEIGISARIGMNFEGPDKDLPWRFFIKDNLWVSKQR